MRYQVLALLLVAGIPAFGQSPWRAVWSDEFDGITGAPPDAGKWVMERGAGGWGNSELQKYVADTSGAFLDGKGHLVIRSSKTPEGGYTSARLKTEGKFSVPYGQVEG